MGEDLIQYNDECCGVEVTVELRGENAFGLWSYLYKGIKHWESLESMELVNGGETIISEVNSPHFTQTDVAQNKYQGDKIHRGY